MRITRAAQRQLVAAGHDPPQKFDLGIALDDFEAGADLMNAIVDGLELGRLVDDEFAGGHLAAIVQPAGDFELVPLQLGQMEIAERALFGGIGRPGEHVGQLGDAMAMPAGIARLGVDGAGKDLEERAEQVPLRLDQHLVVERHRGLAGERLDQRHNLSWERDGVPFGGSRVDQLQHANHLAIVVLERDAQKGLRAIAGPLVEGTRAAEVETRRVIGIGQVDRLAGYRRRRDDVLVVRRAVRVAQRDRRVRDRRPGGAAQGDPHRVVAHDHEAQLAASLADEVEGPAIGIGQFLGAEQDLLQEAVVVVLRRQCDTELDQPRVREFPVIGNRR